MARYDVKFSCGHEETVEVFGKASEREYKIKYFEQHGLCSHCYALQKEESRRKEKEITKEKNKKYGICAALSGSEKQVSWAEDIRKEFYEDFFQNLEDYKDFCGECPEYGKINASSNFIEKALMDFINAQTEARFWIDNRRDFIDLAMDILKSAEESFIAASKMSRSDIFKLAHEKTREMKKKYKNVDYKAQFSLCLKAIYALIKK